MLIKRMTSLVLGCLLVLGALACDGDVGFNDDPVCETLSQAQMDEVSDALRPMILLLSEGVTALPGVVFVVDEQAMTASLSFEGYEGDKTQASFDGQLDLTNEISGDIADLSVLGTLVLTEGQVAEIVMDFTLSLPWDADEGDFAGPPIHIDGTISLDGAACDAARFPDLNPEADVDLDPHFLVAGMQGTIPLSQDGSTWEDVAESDETGTSLDFYGVACDEAGACMAVGDGGTVAVSTDALSWTSKTEGSGERLNSVATCDGDWLAVGHSGVMLASADQGENWTVVDSTSQQELRGVGCSGADFVAVGQSGTLLLGHADTGFVTADSLTPSLLRSVASDGNGVWVSVGESGAILRSDDSGVTWAMVTTGFTQHFENVAFGQGRFVAVGQGASGWGDGIPPILIFSGDGGLSWTEVGLPGEFSSQNRPLGGIATDGKGRWSAAGNGGDHLLSTDNGDSWQVVRLEGWGLYDIAYRP